MGARSNHPANPAWEDPGNSGDLSHFQFANTEGESAGGNRNVESSELRKRWATSSQSILDTKLREVVDGILSGNTPLTHSSHLRRSSLQQYERLQDSIFGVSRTCYRSFFGALHDQGRDKEFALVSHQDPDLDAIASLLLAREIIPGAGSALYCGDGSMQSLLQRMPRSAPMLALLPTRFIDEAMQILLFDGPNTEDPSIGLPGREPLLTLDHHAGWHNGIVNLTFPGHGATTTPMLAIRLHSHSEESTRLVDNEHWQMIATWAFLAICSDTGELTRASAMDLEAVRFLLPFLDPAMIKEFSGSPIEREVQSYFTRACERPRRVQGDCSVFHLGQVCTRDAAAKVADRLMHEFPGSSIYFVTAQIGNSLRGFLRIDPSVPVMEDWDMLGRLRRVFAEGSGGVRDRIGGGRIPIRDSTHPQDEERTLEERFLRHFSPAGRGSSGDWR